MNKKEIQKRAIRHGECLILPVKKLPKNAKEVYKGTEYTVAHSETGHHHVAVGELSVLTVPNNPNLYLNVTADSLVKHLKAFDKHETKTLFKGIYEVRKKSEFDPFLSLLREVRD